MQFYIFCDGGIGNRINALISGLAVANYFNLKYHIYWPQNNWCQASFNQIFKNEFPCSAVSIKDLKGRMNNTIFLLHDSIASESLEVNFSSAYNYSSMQDFQEKVLINKEINIFYYPAVAPDWIPLELIIWQLKNLVFDDLIFNSTLDFIKNQIKSPFYGLHLRRTDLNVGFSDQEVYNVLKRHPNDNFFVCSDDPFAEELASVHPNAFYRKKLNHVVKKYDDSDWISKSEDDDGRIYFGNVSRGSRAVIEGAIDLLILAHSEIIGYSGSTFQKLAKTIGEYAPIIKLNKPQTLEFFSPTESLKKLESNLLSPESLLFLCHKIGLQGDIKDAISLLQIGSNHFSGSQYLDIIHTLGIFALNQNQPKIAKIYLTEVTNTDITRYSSWLHLAYCNFLIKDKYQMKLAFFNSENSNLLEYSHSELQIRSIIKSDVS